MKLLMPLVPVLCCTLAWGQAQHSASIERERIASQRAAVNQRFDAAQRDCQGRFVVASCIDQAKAERRAAMKRLHQEQALLDAADRRQKAAERVRRIEERNRSGDARPSAAQVRVRARTMPSPTPGAGVRPHQNDEPSPIGGAQSPADTVPASAARADRGRVSAPKGESAAEASSRSARVQARAKRLAETAGHRQAVLERNTQRAAQKPPAAPLPAP
jgi:hypothetical protein